MNTLSRSILTPREPLAKILQFIRDNPLNFLVTTLFFISVTPVLMVDIPAMVDYPNHLARMHVLAAAGTPSANPFYEVRWKLDPYLAMDLVVPQLARVMSVEAATRIFLLLSQIITVSGAVALELAVKRRHELCGFAALIALYCVPFSWGFTNYQFTLGVALWAIAAWIWLERRPWPIRLAVHSFLVVTLFIGHLFALGIYGVVIGLRELSKLPRSGIAPRLGNFGIMAAPASVLLLVVVATGTSVRGVSHWEIASKLPSIFRVWNGYSVIFATICASAIIVLIYNFARQRSISSLPEGPWVAGGLLLLFLALPFRLFGVPFADVRVVVAAILIVPAFFAYTPVNRYATPAAIAITLVVIIGNVVTVAWVWRSYQMDYAALKSSLALIVRPSRILVASDGDVNLSETPIYHAPALAASARSFVATLFTFALPIAVREDTRHLEIPTHNPVPIALLKSIARNTNDGRIPIFIRRWTQEFDYLYVVGPRTSNPLPASLQELAAGERFTLYRIIPNAATP
jgi:hypothetical protein